jgi:DNA recombination protein RmuC
VTDILLPVLLLLLVAVLCVLLLILRKQGLQIDSTLLFSRLDTFEKGQERTESLLREEAARSREELSRTAREQRQELSEAFKGFGDSVVQRMRDVASIQKERLESMSAVIAKLADSTEKKFEALRVTVEGKLQSMQDENAKQLEQMRQTVDEKLQGTLEKRLGDSFKHVCVGF